jgi:mono/diheme cytochrome c family protein
MKTALSLLVVLLATVLLASCQSSLKSAPPITESFIRAGLREKADGQTLAEGRKVFLTRCIGCHALPEIARYDSARIPRIVGWMSGRAHLTHEQDEALVKYLLTVKAQEPL